MTGGKGTPFLTSSSLTRSPLHRPGSADIYIYMYTLIHTHTNFPMCFALFVVTLTARDSREIAFSYQGAVPTFHLTPCEAAKDQLLLVGNDIIERQQQIWSLFDSNTRNDLDKVR